jgi:hypothetical protein
MYIYCIVLYTVYTAVCTYYAAPPPLTHSSLFVFVPDEEEGNGEEPRENQNRSESRKREGTSCKKRAE